MEMRNFWLYFGIFLVCTGIGTASGIIILILYFWNDIKTSIVQNNSNDLQQSVENSEESSQFYDDETLEEMK